MNKSKLILPISILIGCFILGGFYCINESKNQVSIKNEKQIESISFDKKVECAKFIPQLKEEADKNYSTFIEIFYSEKDDSCLYTTERYDGKGNLSTRNFQNALTKETIKFDTFYYDCGNSYMGCNDDKLNAKQIENNRRQDMKKKQFDELINSYR